MRNAVLAGFRCPEEKKKEFFLNQLLKEIFIKEKK